MFLVPDVDAHEDDKDVPPSGDVADLTFKGMGLLQTFFCIDVECHV